MKSTYYETWQTLPQFAHSMLYTEQVLLAKNKNYPWPEDKSVFYGELSTTYHPEARHTFALPYYLIPAEIATYLESLSLDDTLKSHLKTVIKDKTYFRLFIHPEEITHYQLLQGYGGQFVCAEKTEYRATPTSSYRSLLVWLKQTDDINHNIFIVKLSINKTIFTLNRSMDGNEITGCIAIQRIYEDIGLDRLRSSHFIPFMEVAGLFSQPLSAAHAPLGGQLIRQIPAAIIKNELRWIPFHALMDTSQPEGPLIQKVIAASGLTAKDFIQKYLIDNYIEMVEAINFKKGLAFQAHLQNLLFETDSHFQPTGNFVIRDYSDMRIHIYLLLAHEPGLSHHSDYPHAALKYGQGLGFFMEYFMYSYLELTFKLLLDTISQLDNTVCESDVGNFVEQLQQKWINLVNHYFSTTTTLDDYNLHLSFPENRHYLCHFGNFISKQSLNRLPPGNPLRKTDLLMQRMLTKVETAYWHDLNNLFSEIDFSKNEIQSILGPLQFSLYNNLIIARDHYNQIAGFTYYDKSFKVEAIVSQLELNLNHIENAVRNDWAAFVSSVTSADDSLLFSQKITLEEKEESMFKMFHFVRSDVLFTEFYQSLIKALLCVSQEDCYSIGTGSQTQNATELLSVIKALEANGFLGAPDRPINFWCGTEAMEKAFSTQEECSNNHFASVAILYRLAHILQEQEMATHTEVSTSLILAAAISRYYTTYAKGAINIYLSTQINPQSFFCQHELPLLRELKQKNIVTGMKLHFYDTCKQDWRGISDIESQDYLNKVCPHMPIIG